MKLKNNSLITVPFHCLFVLISGLALFNSPNVFSDASVPDAQQLINEMSRAARNLNYDGVFMYRRGNQIDTMRIIHKSGEDGEYERLVSLTGNAREVIRDKDSVRCFFPDNQEVIVEKSHAGKLISSYLPHPIESISSMYSFIIAGTDRIAGKDAWIVNIIPKDSYRYGYQLWIDKKTNLLLKSELKNKVGITLEQIMFAQLDVFDDIADELLQPSISTQGYTWHERNMKSNSDSSKNSDWKVNWMPNGFQMSKHEQQLVAANEEQVEYIVFSDGLAIVSVFVEQKSPGSGKLFQGESHRGGVNAYSLSSDGYHVTVVGEVPRATVKLMAMSVKKQN